ncbi:MAG: carbohydrate ABC transporter permease [bacterium]|nr:carbohydrate ABC transporter permease [bacterium]
MRKSGKITGIISKILIYFMLTILALSMLIPFLWMVSTSFMNELEVYSYPPKLLPEKFLWQNYKEALTLLPFDRYFFNSILVTLFSVVGQVFTCSMAAYAFSRLKWKGRDRVFAIYLSTMMIPVIVTLIPSFLIINTFGWMNTYYALVTPTLTSVWGIFLLRQFFQSIPKTYEDAARIDGASEFTIYWKVIMPLSKPALATLSIFTFMATWKDFLWPLIVTNNNNMRTVEIGIAQFHSVHSTQWPYQMAAAVVAMLPIIIIF